jgi:hypothetical protein
VEGLQLIRGEKTTIDSYALNAGLGFTSSRPSGQSIGMKFGGAGGHRSPEVFQCLLRAGSTAKQFAGGELPRSSHRHLGRLAP